MQIILQEQKIQLKYLQCYLLFDIIIIGLLNIFLFKFNENND